MTHGVLYELVSEHRVTLEVLGTQVQGTVQVDWNNFHLVKQPHKLNLVSLPSNMIVLENFQYSRYQVTGLVILHGKLRSLLMILAEVS